MPTDNEPLASLDELASILERHEGPAEPRPSSPRRRSVLRRSSLVAVTALLIGSGLGFGAANWLTPSGSAAPAPLGLGFLPERGWSVLQNGGDGTPAEPALAIAANVELNPADDSNGLPLSTLEGLPPDGVVIVATFITRGKEIYSDKRFPTRTLPLKVRDAAPSIEWGVQVRPSRPLGQFQLRAAVNGHHVDVNIYFGGERPSPTLLSAAQRQLDRLVVRADPVPAPTLAAPHSASARTAATATTVIDRTFSCSTTPDTLRKIQVSAVSGFRDPENRQRWKWLPSARVNARFIPIGSLDVGALPDARWRAVEINADRCKASGELVRLSTTGLTGGSASQLQGSDAYECIVSNRILVRVRAVFPSRVTLGVQTRFGRRTLTTTRAVAAQQGQLSVRTLTGKPLAYASASETGKATLFVSPRCVSD